MIFRLLINFILNLIFLTKDANKEFESTRPYRENIKITELARKSALDACSKYLKPYSDIWGTLTLENNFCKITIHSKWKFITCQSKQLNNNHKFRFKAVASGMYNLDAIWNDICRAFDDSTKYDTLKNALINVTIIKESFSYTPTAENEPQQKISTESSIIKRTDINNATEQELTELPGISAILAKKIVQFREREREFSSVEDFFKVMNIKEHFQMRLLNIITVNPIEIEPIRTDNNERTVDL